MLIVSSPSAIHDGQVRAELESGLARHPGRWRGSMHPPSQPVTGRHPGKSDGCAPACVWALAVHGRTNPLMHTSPAKQSPCH
eukprot:4015988-Amphidinium_carterae.1